jgi:hypothetical protein
MLDAEKDAAGEHGEGEVPFLDACLPDRPEGPAHAGIIEDAVEAAEFGNGEIDEAGDVGLPRDVGSCAGEPRDGAGL